MNNDKRILEIKNLVENAEISLQQARKILVDLVGSEEEKIIAREARESGRELSSSEGQVIEGIFDGQNMVGPDEKKYSVPANYASKSKLIEGDSLKLTITPDGSFVYKQINLLDRDRIVGELIIDEATSEFRVLANNKSYKVLNASITYFKGQPHDKVTILVPKDRESSWAAVENIFKPGQEVEMDYSNEVKDEENEVDDYKNTEEANKVAEHIAERVEEQVDDGIAERVNDEFLAQDHEQQVENLKDDVAEEPKDIFEAASEVETDDVGQVDLGANDADGVASLINNQGSNNLEDDLDADKDSQGLEQL